MGIKESSSREKAVSFHSERFWINSDKQVPILFNIAREKAIQNIGETGLDEKLLTK